MSFPWATRSGALRYLRLGNAFSRSTRVISVQNQLRQVCIATKPQLQTSFDSLKSALLFQQSRSLTTAAESGESKPQRKLAKSQSSKGKKKAAAKPGRKQKKLTEEQQKAKDERLQRVKIKELKKAALQPPKQLPRTAWTLACQSKLKEVRDFSGTPREKFTRVAELARNMSPEELERFRIQAEENYAANKVARKAWLETLSPQQIKDANSARHKLNRLTGSHLSPLKDERLVKQPRTAYWIYLMERRRSGDFKNLPTPQGVSQMADEWRSMNENEKKPWYEKQARDRERYEREHLEAYGEPVKPSVAPKAKEAVKAE